MKKKAVRKAQTPRSGQERRKGYVLVGQKYFEELEALRKHFEEMQRILIASDDGAFGASTEMTDNKF